MPLPGLHVVTDDEVLASAGFPERARALIEAHGPALAIHVRGPGTPVARLLAVAAALIPAARDSGALLLLNDRVDIALAVDADGVQLGRRSLPVAAARGLAPDWVIGVSVHGPDEAASVDGADFLLLGTIWETASHPGWEGAGVELVRRVRARVRIPIIAIGGVTPERAADARDAGAAGVAAIRGIWESDDPVASAADYLEGWGMGRESA